jgi:hypothetical protein
VLRINEPIAQLAVKADRDSKALNIVKIIMHSAVGLSSLDLYNIKTTLHELLMDKNIDMLCGMKGFPKYVVFPITAIACDCLTLSISPENCPDPQHAMSTRVNPVSRKQCKAI